MNTRRHSNILALVASTALVSASLTGCVQEQPPELPPVGSLTANIEVVEAAPDEAKNADPAGVGDYTNFANAWVRVKILQLYAGGVILIPAVVMAAALAQEPRQEGEAWIWTVTAGGATADLELRANLAGWDIDLYVTNADVERFLWIEGDFDVDLGAGTWRANDANRAAGENAVLEIAWNYLADNERSLVFTNVDQQSPDVGDVLSYTISGNTATVGFDDADNPEQIAQASWDNTTGVGDVEVPLYNNGERACWDTTFSNVACE